jgi:hypothetical protein
MPRLKRLILSGDRGFFRVWLPALLAMLALDAAFPRFFWKIPRLWKPPEFGFSEADWGYQIALERIGLLEPKAEGAVRVLAFGSSTARALDPYQVEGLLRAGRAAPRAEVRRLMMPSVQPSEFLLLFEGEELPTPDVAVILFNPVDFLYPNDERRVNDMLPYAASPLALWRARYDTLAADEQIELALSQLSNLFRYHRQIQTCLSDHALAGARRWLGPPPPASWGIHADGYTDRRFALELTGNAPLEYFVAPEWIAQRGRIRLDFRSGGETLATQVETRSGWKSVALPAPARIEVVADSSWSPRAAGADDERLLGVKLRHPPPRGVSDGGAEPYRHPFLEEGELEPLLRIPGKRGAEADRAWDELLHADTHSARRMRRAWKAKTDRRDQPFAADKEYLGVQALVEHFRARGSRVILVSTPDHPHIRGDYANGTYYRGYREFFRSLASAPDVAFHDLGDALPAEDFNDGHHVNYIGVIKLGPRFAQMVERGLE